MTRRLLILIAFLAIPLAVHAQVTETRDIAFPTEQSVIFYDDFGELRAGHTHEGNDLLGKKMMPLYAAVNGRVDYLVIPEETWGYAIVLKDTDGYTYHYLHVNNDTPGTDDGAGGVQYAYAPGIERGVTVTKGQLIGWMGDSGNAENASAHLHFEIRRPDGTAFSPYASLVAAKYPGSYSAADATAESPDINTDKGLVPVPGTTSLCDSGSLIKSASSTAVYYCGANGKRYVFPNDKIYFTWYTDFKTVKTVTNEQLAALPLGGLITYRPGIKMVKIESIPNVYAVEKGGVLRWIKSPEIAASIYGTTWKKKVDDVSDAFFTSYKFGADITSIRQ